MSQNPLRGFNKHSEAVRGKERCFSLGEAGIVSLFHSLEKIEIGGRLVG